MSKLTVAAKLGANAHIASWDLRVFTLTENITERHDVAAVEFKLRHSEPSNRKGGEPKPAPTQLGVGNRGKVARHDAVIFQVVGVSRARTESQLLKAAHLHDGAALLATVVEEFFG